MSGNFDIATLENILFKSTSLISSLLDIDFIKVLFYLAREFVSSLITFELMR